MMSRNMVAAFMMMCCLFPHTAISEDILVFGDSWGTEGGSAFKAVAAKYNQSVRNVAHGGLTAHSVAEGHPDALLQDVNATKGVKYVWLTIGGDDAAPEMEKGANVSVSAAPRETAPREVRSTGWGGRRSF